MGKFSKSNKQLSFKDIANMFDIRKKSLKLYYSVDNPNYLIDFHGYRPDEIKKEHIYNNTEVEFDACLNLLAAIEALFKLDYIIRCEKRDKDKISKRFKDTFGESPERVSLEDVIFEEWKQEPMINESILSELKGAFKFRHYLAHGRFKTFKGGMNKYTFDYLKDLALAVNEFPLKRR